MDHSSHDEDKFEPFKVQLMALANCSTGHTNLTWEAIQKLFESSKNNDQAGDATWILTSAFIIFTMQSGFGLLEAGTVSSKNESNIMVKNAVDVIFGALGYWVCGFAFSFGDNPEYSNGFTGFGHFFTDEDGHGEGKLFAKYFFQLSFATTATTIVSGAMAERANLKAYMFFSFVNFFSYVFPAHWIWAENGVFFKLGVVDVAGCGPVHLVGGVSALVASIMLKPRIGVFENGKKNTPKMGCPTNVLLGTFMLWWGWLGFNCGSTFGVSGGKWKLATRAAVTTLNASTGAGIWGMVYCYTITKKFDGKLDIGTFTASLLGGLVSITAVCAICNPWEAILIGMTGGIIATYGIRLMDWLQIDDPVSAIPVHGFCGLWGMIVVGLVGELDTLEGISRQAGIFKGGPISYLGYQVLAALTIATWAAGTAFLELLLANFIFGLRVKPEEELLGADFCEHGILQPHQEQEKQQQQQQQQQSQENIKHSEDIKVQLQKASRRTIEEMVEDANGDKVFTIDHQSYSKYKASPALHRNNVEIGDDNYAFEFNFPKRFNNNIQSVARRDRQTRRLSTTTRSRNINEGNANNSINTKNGNIQRKNNADQFLNVDILEWSNGGARTLNGRTKTPAAEPDTKKRRRSDMNIKYIAKVK